MGFEAGLKAAAKMLGGLGPDERQRLLKIIADKNPEMAQALKENLISFEDLIHITPKMMVELLRQIKVDDLALSLRVASPELKAHLFKMLPSGVVRQIEDTLMGPPQLVSKVEEAREQVMQVVLKMCDQGQLILRPGGNDKLV